MESQNQLNELEKKVQWNKRHLRIVFVIASVTFLMLAGHFVLHGLGKL